MMIRSRTIGMRVLALSALVVLAACQDTQVPMEPAPDARMSRVAAGQEMRALFARTSPDVMALPQTVFAAYDEAAGQLVFGVETRSAGQAAQALLARQGVPASAYRMELVDPIHFMSDNLRSEHRPTVGGLQIHWDGYVCTLGFNVSHALGRSFITNSHCTTIQGENSGTFYNQPSRTASPTPIADEADDPAYKANVSGCSSGKRCRDSDAARALYRSGATSSQGVIAKTTGVNNGSLAVAGSFSITEQNNTGTSFSGTLHKVGRTTGWSSGNVTNTCATVNVSGSDIQLLCQTLVQRRGRQIVGGGDSGSPVFQVLSGDNVRLVGILWGGSMNGDLFVFSPLKNIQGELGAVTATVAGNGGGEEPAAPNAPSAMSAAAVSSSAINLNWNDNSNNEDGFRIERCQGSGCSSFSQIATVGANFTAFQNTGLSASTSYSYRVRAYNAGGNSNYSNTASATTQEAIESSVVLSINGYKIQGRMHADLAWSPIMTAPIDIWRQAGTGGTWEKIRSRIEDTGSFTDSTTFVGGGTLSYQVCEPDAAQGSTACSNVASWTF
jgi:hypothetical protein